MWTEYETISPTFFTNLMAFILGNCVAGRVNRLIMRMTNPLPMWLPTASSPFFTQFLSKLHANGIVVDLVLFPYMMTPASRLSWGVYAGKPGAPLDGVMMFMNRWNALIADSGFKSNFKGIVFDLEERRHGWMVFPAIDVDAGTVANLKSRFGQFEFGVSIGWDDATRFAAMPWVDKWYTQMYDLYDRTGALDRGKRNPFVKYQNDPQGMVNYLINTLIPPWIKVQYNRFQAKIMPMWSWQSPSNKCLYVYSNGICVGNAEFGVWTASAFNLFVNRMMASWPAMANMDHGVYHFGLLPSSWR
jgi:hypothetical protein